MNTATPELRAIFWEALDRPTGAERRAYLDGACGADEGLRSRVEALLHAHREAGDFLAVPASTPTVTWGVPAPVEGPGETIGSYKLLEAIGEGGMGTVYMAEQAHPVRRKVALKLIKPGMDSRQVVGRFEVERQALALMDHPNIAKVLDAGATDTGRPYFVMELVNGIPITDYCDRACLSVPERLDLLILVCRAVQHAHQKGIIHRDLKPSNILVTLIDGAAVPKVIDFGVAKATGGQLTEGPLFTGFAQMIGTPLYMSPEQAEFSGVDVDTRSDIYALGVLLYELLTGTTPIDRETLCKAAYDEIRRVIREQEPPTPSTRLGALGVSLSAVSANRHTDSRKLGHVVRGELDWIAMKALEKDRRRRYETANDFAADVMRYLTDQPVEACPPSAWYRYRKFMRRNRSAIATASALAAALVLGTALSTWQAALARRAERDAIAARADTETFSKFLVDDVLAVARPEGMQGGLGVDVTVAQALEAAEKHLDERFAGRPLAEATARDAIGKTWRNLEKFEQAERHLRRAVDLRQQGLGPDDPATLDSLNSLGVTLTQMGRHDEAVPLLKETLGRYRAKIGPDHRDTFTGANNLAFVYGEAGQYDKSLPLLEKTVEAMKAKLGPDDPLTLSGMYILASQYLAVGRIDRGLPLLEETVKKRKAKLGPDHPDTVDSIAALAVRYRLSNLDDRALPLFEEAREKYRARYGPDHTATLINGVNLASVYRDAGQPHKAEPLFIEAVSGFRRKLGLTHPTTELSIRHLAVCYERLGTPEKAEALLRELAAAWRDKAGEHSPQYLDHLTLIGWCLIQQRPAEAEALCRDALEVARRLNEEKSPGATTILDNLGMALLRQRKYTDAEQTFRACVEIIEKKHLDDWFTYRARSRLGASLLGQERYDEAEPLLLAGYEGMKQREAKMEPHHKFYLNEALERLVELYDARGQNDKADEWRIKLTGAASAKPAGTRKD